VPDLWELGAREEIRDLAARYAHGVDRGRFDEVAALFLPDGVLEVVGGELTSGRDAIRAYLGGVGARGGDAPPLAYIRHHVSNVLVELDARDRATARSYFFVVTDRGPDHWGRYRDHVVHDGERWLLARRVVSTDRVAPGSWAEQRR
jgi:uncharacterized protein (TIGR02246 family)